MTGANFEDDLSFMVRPHTIIRMSTTTQTANCPAKQHSRPVRLLLTLGKAAGCAAAFFTLGFFLFAALIEGEPQGEAATADGIVALTGGEERISEAVRLLASGKARRLLISGVHPGTSRQHLTRLNPDGAQLFQCCIDLDQNAQDTIGNAQETSAWARQRGFKKLIVVTSTYHMPRSLIELRRELPGVQFIAHAVKPRNFHGDAWWAHPGTLRLLLSEYLKFWPSLARYVGSRIFGHEGGGFTAQASLDATGANPDPSPDSSRE